MYRKNTKTGLSDPSRLPTYYIKALFLFVIRHKAPMKMIVHPEFAP